MPVASTMPKSVSVLIEKPKSLTNANVPTSDTGIVMAGMIVLRQFCRNRNITSTTRPMASASVISTSTDRLADDHDVVERDLRLEARRKVLPQPFEFLLDAREHLNGVRRRQQLDADAGRLPRRRTAAATSSSRRPDRRGRRRLHADERAVLARLDDDVLELLAPR